MKFFVSGKAGVEESARELMKALQDAGHEITFDWTTIGHLRPYDDNAAACREAAIKESRGVKGADVLIILEHDSGVGMYAELGMAIASGVPVRIVTDVESRTMFCHHPLVKKVSDVEQILKEFC